MAEPNPDAVIIVYPTASELKEIPAGMLPTFTEEDFASLTPEQIEAIHSGLGRFWIMN
jgi:hypothetical protein